jgi:hypothetical protein
MSTSQRWTSPWRAGRHLGLECACALAGERLETARAREEELMRMSERLLAKAGELLASGCSLEPELLQLKEQLAAELLAERSEDAGLLEAWLRPTCVATGGRKSRRCSTSNCIQVELSFLDMVAEDERAAMLGAAECSHHEGPRDVCSKRIRLCGSHESQRGRLRRKALEGRAAELREKAALREQASERLLNWADL